MRDRSDAWVAEFAGGELVRGACTDDEAGTVAQPDIALEIRARARSVEIVQKGEAKLAVTAEPDAGSRVEAEITPKAEGRTKLRNVEVTVRGAAAIAAPGGPGAEIGAAAETGSPR